LQALVTGGGSGIGRATCRRLAADGYHVWVCDLDIAAAQRVQAEIVATSGVATACVVDVSDESSVETLFARVRATAEIDCLVTAAGIQLLQQDAPVHELDTAVWRRTIDVNLTGTFLTLKYGVRSLLARGGGAVVTIGSPDGIYGMEPRSQAYSASKAGIHGLTRAMAVHYASAGIRVNTVIPGFINTPMNATIMDDPKALEQGLASVPLHRVGTPEEVASVIGFICQPSASYVTGSLVFVDGGLTAQ
jgi:NAD(P)-dependent dehydrogenase (short-subunit alcohol dehydrogenase family)